MLTNYPTFCQQGGTRRQGTNRAATLLPETTKPGAILSEIEPQCAKYNCSGYLEDAKERSRHHSYRHWPGKPQVANFRQRGMLAETPSHLPRTGIFCTFEPKKRQHAAGKAKSVRLSSTYHHRSPKHARRDRGNPPRDAKKRSLPFKGKEGAKAFAL